MKNLKQEIIHDHSRNPRNQGTLDNADFTSGEHNPSCGDNITITGTVRDGFLTDIAFEGKGCSISQATASMLTEACKNKSIEMVRAYSTQNLIDLLGIDLGPTRLKCALLPLSALQKGIDNYSGDDKK